MSMTIFSKADPSINVSFAYSRFFDLRLQIAKSINYELGRIYENSRPPATAKTAEACKQWDSLFQIVNKRSQALMIFLETPDYEGKATAAICKKLMQYKPDFDSPEYTEWYKENILKPFWAVIKSGTIKGIEWH